MFNVIVFIYLYLSLRAYWELGIESLKCITHIVVRSPILASSFHVSGSTPLYIPLLLTTMITTGSLYLERQQEIILVWRELSSLKNRCSIIQSVLPCQPAHGLNLHAWETKGTVPLYTHDPMACALAPLKSCCCNSKSQADSHCTKRPGIQPAWD